MRTHEYLIIGDSTYKSGCKVIGSSTSSTFALKNKSILEVQIPSYFNGAPIVEIGNNAFENAKITKIFIPKTILFLGTECFDYCHELTEVRFEKGSQLEKLGKWVFFECSKLERIDIPASFRINGYPSNSIFTRAKALWCISYLGSTDFSNSDFFNPLSDAPSNIRVSSLYPSDKLGRTTVTSRNGKTCGCSSEPFFKTRIETIFIRRNRNSIFIVYIFHYFILK